MKQPRAEQIWEQSFPLVQLLSVACQLSRSLLTVIGNEKFGGDRHWDSHFIERLGPSKERILDRWTFSFGNKTIDFVCAGRVLV